MRKCATAILLILAGATPLHAAWSGKYTLLLVLYTANSDQSAAPTLSTRSLGVFDSGPESLNDCTNAAQTQTSMFSIPGLQDGRNNLRATLICVPTN
jgi:hypothetical protein